MCNLSREHQSAWFSRLGRVMGRFTTAENIETRAAREGARTKFFEGFRAPSDGLLIHAGA
jgi:hypothetical protein